MRHVTLDTGHVRESARSEVGDDVVAQVQAYLRAALAAPDGIVAIEVPFDRALLHVTADGDLLLVTVLVRVDRVIAGAWIDAAPLVVLGVAPTEARAGELWRLLHDCDAPKATRGSAPPAAPWCAASLQVGIALYPEAAGWLGDLERCVAWAWVEEERARH